jgi:hypothetical protein
MFRRVIGILAVVIGAAVFLYFAWAAHRIGYDALREPGWPRPSPYPDRWLLALSDYYDAKYPVTGPYIKLRGELPRVMRDVTRTSRAGAVVCIAGFVTLLLPTVLRRVRSRNRGFEVFGPGAAVKQPPPRA